jgi:hypothetical protein
MFLSVELFSKTSLEKEAGNQRSGTLMRVEIKQKNGTSEREGEGEMGGGVDAL